MKQFFLACLCAAPGIAFSQDQPQPFTIEGTIANARPIMKMYVEYYAPDAEHGFKRELDSSVIKDGSFHFSGTAIMPAMATLIEGNMSVAGSIRDKIKDQTAFFLDAGSIK